MDKINIILGIIVLVCVVLGFFIFHLKHKLSTLENRLVKLESKNADYSGENEPRHNPSYHQVNSPHAMCDDDTCPIYPPNFKEQGMFSGGNPLSSLFGSLLSGRQNNNFEVIEEEDSQELESDIQKLREEIGDDISEVSENYEQDNSQTENQEIIENEIKDLVNKNIDTTEVSTKEIDNATSEVDVLSNGKILNGKKKFNASQFDDLGDTDHIENDELEHYIRDSNLNAKDDLEHQLSTQPDTLSNISISGIQKIVEPFSDASLEVKVNVIANNQKLSDLRDLCKNYGLGTKGTKPDLVRKLLDKYPKLFDKEQNNLNNLNNDNTN